MKQKAVLVFDANQRSALASVRALGKRNDLVVYTCDSTNVALAGSSRFSTMYFKHPDMRKSSSKFIEWLKKTIDARDIAYLFPVSEISSRTILDYKSELKAEVPFAELETVLNVSDKNVLMAKAIELGLPVPKTQFCSDVTSVEFDELTYPCVLKPSLSRVSVNNQWFDTKVHIVHDEEELHSVFRETDYLKNLPFMLQEFIDGYGAGLFVYYQRGKAKAFFAHQRLREKPPEGGVSVLSKSVSINPEMQEYSEQLLNAVKWHGAAMVEYRVSTEGTPYLMEINARLWGSLQLAIDSGVNFPSLLIDGQLEGEVDMVSHYKTDCELRWLLGDLDNLYLTWKSKNIPLSTKFKSFLEFFMPSNNVRRYEVNRFEDLSPFWFEVKQYVGLIK